MTKIRLAALFLLTAMLPLANAQTFKVLHVFDDENRAAEPEGSVIRDSAGNIFGTTVNAGAVFKIDSKGKETDFFYVNGGELGIFPTGALTQDAASNIYGVAEGGSGGAGVVYKLSPQAKETILFAFQGGLHPTNPVGPAGGVLLGKNGDIFGAAEFGIKQACAVGCGAIFRLDAAGAMHLLHVFTGGVDGGNPVGPLVQDAAGNMYGVTESGGDFSCQEFIFTPHKGCGVVFKIAKDRTFTVLHAFAGGADGAIPQGGLLLDKNGNLFGAAAEGGLAQNGTVYEISSDGIYSVVHRFTKPEGQHPNGGLVEDASGNIFGTTQLGGDQVLGTVFELNPQGSVRVLHSFQGLEDGASPLAGLFRDSAGNLYGTTPKNFLVDLVQGGGVFEVTP